MLQEKIVSPTTLVSNGCFDIRGKIADKQTTGGWKASPFIIGMVLYMRFIMNFLTDSQGSLINLFIISPILVNEVAERLAFFAIAVNMVAYLVFQMHQSLPTAATHVTDWIGAAYVLTLFGAFLADAYLGRFLTIIIFSCVYVVVSIIYAYN